MTEGNNDFLQLTAWMYFAVRMFETIGSLNSGITGNWESSVFNNWTSSFIEAYGFFFFNWQLTSETDGIYGLLSRSFQKSEGMYTFDSGV